MRIFLIFSFFSLFVSAVSAQNSFTVNGYVKDAANGEGMIGAVVYVQEKPAAGVSSNAYGFYSLTLPKGSYTLVFSYVGYTTQTMLVELTANKTADIQFSEEQNQLQEVVVTETNPRSNVQSNQMSVNKLDIRTIKSMPALLGEVDVVRSIQLLPGVSTVGEGASGFNVRGGGVDQNLILQDEAIVYNSSHLLGFFSVFNPDAVKDVKLLKGGIPAQYGGRLSSILDVRLKEGNVKKFAATGGIGTVSSRLTLEAPIIKDKSSFIIAARRTYADLFLKLSSDEALNQNKLYFYDLSAKWNYKINPNNTVFASGYFGKDVFDFSDRFRLNWGSLTGTLRWNHVFTPKLFSNFTATYSNYNYLLGVPSGTQSFEWTSNIQNANAKVDFTYYPNAGHTFNFGASAIRYWLRPGQWKPLTDNSIFTNFALDGQDAVEYGAYMDHEQNFGSRVTLQYGLRLSLFDYRGPHSVYEYTGELEDRKKPVNERIFGKQSIVAYPNLEPRAALKYGLDNNSSLKLSYNRMAQYIHLISNTTAANPLDIWQPSTTNIKPEIADQVALGYFRNLKDDRFETSVEVYYKNMTNQIDYVNGAQTLLNPDLEGDLLYGNGRAYGVEFFVKKNTGKLTGWVSYTLSRTERQIDGINNNEWYAAKYDRTHNLSVVGIYELNKKWSFSANFSYLTGTTTTFPNSRYSYDGLIVPHNSDNSRNNFRVPAYHRLDLSATLRPKRNENHRWKGEWVFTVYNAYARRNPFTIYFRQKLQGEGINAISTSQTEAVRLSVFGTLIPAVTYNFNF